MWSEERQLPKLFKFKLFEVLESNYLTTLYKVNLLIKEATYFLLRFSYKFDKNKKHLDLLKSTDSWFERNIQCLIQKIILIKRTVNLVKRILYHSAFQD